MGGRRGATPLSYLIYKDRKITQNHWKSLNNFINRGRGGEGKFGDHGGQGGFGVMEVFRGSSGEFTYKEVLVNLEVFEVHR